MTTDAQELAAGPELDALVAERGMGWRDTGVPPFEYWANDAANALELKECWRPSRDIADAWRVVERMREHGWSYAIWETTPISSVLQGPVVAFRRGVYPPRFRDHPDPESIAASAQTVPEAICKASLLAVGSMERRE